jgi:hypothetical protein
MSLLMGVLVGVMKRLEMVAELGEVLKRYRECLDVDPVVPTAVSVVDDVCRVVCDKANCTVDTHSGSFVVLANGKAMVRGRVWPWLMTTRELGSLCGCIEHLMGKIEEEIRELDEKIEEMKTLLAQAKLLCS